MLFGFGEFIEFFGVLYFKQLMGMHAESDFIHLLKNNERTFFSIAYLVTDVDFGRPSQKG